MDNMQPSAIMFHCIACIGFIQSLYLAYVHPPTLLRLVYTGSTLTNMYHYGLSAQLHEPSRQTMRLYIPDDEYRVILIARAAKWTSRALYGVVFATDVAYITLVIHDHILISIIMFIAICLYPAMKLLRYCAPEINTTLAKRFLNKKNNSQPTEYSLLDDQDHRNTVQQHFMLKQLPRILAMIMLAACHMALMLDVRNTCNFNLTTSNSSINWLCA
jgi:hypothetical protein